MEHRRFVQAGVDGKWASANADGQLHHEQSMQHSVSITVEVDGKGKDNHMGLYRASLLLMHWQKV